MNIYRMYKYWDYNYIIPNDLGTSPRVAKIFDSCILFIAYTSYDNSYKVYTGNAGEQIFKSLKNKYNDELCIRFPLEKLAGDTKEQKFESLREILIQDLLTLDIVLVSKEQGNFL